MLNTNSMVSDDYDRFSYKRLKKLGRMLSTGCKTINTSQLKHEEDSIQEVIQYQLNLIQVPPGKVGRGKGRRGVMGSGILGP